MPKKIYLLFLLLLCIVKSYTQNINNYTFTPTTGTFTALSGANSGSLTGSTDEGYWNAVPIGFSFWYMGTRYTTVSASTNGWISLGANITAASPINNLTSGGTPRPLIAPLWDDLDMQASTNFSYQTSGAAGNRVFTMQFLNAKWSRAATGNTVSFQVKLYEANGKINFVYRSESGTVNSGSASVGLAATGTSTLNFLSLDGTGTAPGANAYFEINFLSTKPATGQVYSFLSPVPTAAPTALVFSNVTPSSMVLTWSDNSSNESGFLIYRSTDGINYTLITQTDANTATSIQTGLTSNTLYYWKVIAVTEGNFSAAVSGSKTTICVSAAPGVVSPVNLCLNSTATPLTATGSNLLWGAVSGSVGGTTPLTTPINVDNNYYNKKTRFTTTANNVTIFTVDYYIPIYQTVTGLVLSIYNNSGAVIATSSTTSTLSATTSVVKVTATFNYNIVTPGDYSIGISAGTGNLGSDNPAFPLSEPTGTINITGVSAVGYRCFTNIQFSTTGSPAAPTPLTNTISTQTYYVSQTAGGCPSPVSTIVVNVASPVISQVFTSNLIGYYKFNGDAKDAMNTNNGTLQNAPAVTTDRFNIASSAYSFNGSTQYISTATPYASVADFTVSIWFKTNSTTGGRLIGFGSAQTGSSTSADRHIYMNNNGQIYFGIYTGSVVTVNSSAAFNDNNWHLATGTFSSTTGLALYVDGVLSGSNTSATPPQTYTGYWRINGDNLTGVTSAPASNYFSGSLDDALIYQRALSASEVFTVYNRPDGAGNTGAVCTGTTLSLTAAAYSGATYSWSGPNSFTSSAQNPSFNYSLANAGIYTLQVTASGCTVTAYTNVKSTTAAGQWTGNTSTDWADASNWCSGILPTATTNVTIIATAIRMPVISSVVACNNLTINAGATVTTAAAGTLNISGTLTNNGTMTNNGTTGFAGTAQQTFSGVTLFNNVVISNTNGLLLPAYCTFNNLTITAGTLNTNGYNLDVKGNWLNNASATALIQASANLNFSGTAAQTIGGTFETSFFNLYVNTNGSSVTLMNNVKITSNLAVMAGVLDLSTYSANSTASGGILYVSNTGLLRIGGTNTIPTNYTTYTFQTASTVEYSGTNQTVQPFNYGNLLLSSSGGAAIKSATATDFSLQGNLTLTKGNGVSVTFNPGANITIGNDVVIGTATILNGSSYSHTVNGNWTNNGTFNGNTGTIIFAGASKIISGAASGQLFNSITVAASGAIFLNDGISMTGNLATTGSGSFTQVSGSTVTMSGAGSTIGGNSILIDNLTVTGSGTVTAQNSLTFTGSLAMINAGNTFTGATGTTITLSGTTKTISGAGSASFASLNITGAVIASTNFSVSTALIVIGTFGATAGTATFTASAVLNGIANLYNCTENGTKLELSANAVLGVKNVLSFTAGVLDVSTSVPNTVDFNGAMAQNINAITYYNLSLSSGNTKTAAGAITVNNDLTIAAATTFAAVNFTHTVMGNWKNSGTFDGAAGTIQFTGNGNSAITGGTTFNFLTVNKNTAATTVSLLSDVTTAIVNMTQGNIKTGGSTITIKNTRTGPGIILGNITRTNGFITGVQYEFEGPYNTILFTALSGVTSVTVSVVKGTVTDFPSNAAISRLYTIQIPAGTYNATLRLHYEDDELNGNTESQLTQWNYLTGSWNTAGTNTSNSTINNYVEKNNLTNLVSRWTLSSVPSVYSWSGVVDNDWNKKDNWKFAGAAATSLPTATDVVNIGVETFDFQPTIGTAVIVKNIVLGSVKAVILSMATGGSLITGNITGNWTSNATHAININDQTVTINGDMVLSDGTTGHAINMNIGTGSMTISGTLNQTGGANISFTGSGLLNIGNQFIPTSGAFTPGTGTVVFMGAVNQSVGNVTFYNLQVNKTAGVLSVDQAITANGQLTIVSGQMLVSSATDIRGNVTINAGGTLQNDHVLHVGGNWLNNGVYTGNGINIIFDGTGTQNISASTFNNLEINKPVGTVAQLTGDVILKGNLVGTSGTLDIKSFNFNRDVVGGNATITDNGTLIIAADNAPTRFTNYSLSANSTVIFNGTGIQHLALPGVTYGNLIFRNSGQKLLYVSVTVNGNLTIENNATLDGGSNAITLNGNWINNGTFVPGTSTLLWNGTGKTISGATTFNIVTVAGSYAVQSNLVINGKLTITSSGAITSAAGIVNTLNGDLTNSGDLYLLGETIFSGNVVQTLGLINAVRTYAVIITFNGTVSPVLNSTSAPQFAILNVNNTGGVNPSVGWTIISQLNVAAGASFNGGAYTQNILGNMNNNGIITTRGTFNFTPATAVTLNMGTGFTSTGTVVFGGTGAIGMTGSPAFNNVTISNTNATGITASSNWIITSNLYVNSGSILNAGNRTYTVGGDLRNLGTINSGTSLFTLNGTVDQEVSTTTAFNNFTINKASGKATLFSDLPVAGVLQFTKGLITTTTSFVVAQPSGAMVTGASQATGWINGRLKKYIPAGSPIVTFETGDSAYYTPVSLNFSSVSTPGDLTEHPNPGDHPQIRNSFINPSKSVNRYYRLVNSGVVTTGYNATLNFVSSDIDAGANTANFNVQNYNGSSWALPVTTSPLSTSIQASGNTAFGALAIGEICNKGTAISYTATSYCLNGGIATPVITGTTGGTFSADPGLTIDASTGVVNLNTSVLGTYIVTYTIGATTDCGQYITTTTIKVVAAGTWTGETSQSWNDPGNWSCAGVPTASTDVTIPPGISRYPVISDIRSVHDITIKNGATVIISGGILKIAGSIATQGIFDASAGTIDMNGTVAQSIAANSFYNNAVGNLIISNTDPAGVSLAGKLDVYDSLSFSSTGTKLSTNDNLTLKSTATKTARVTNLTGHMFAGEVTVERYIPARRAWYFLSVPTNTTQTVKQAWQENADNTATNPSTGYGTQITSNSGTWSADGFDYLSAGPSMKTYVSAANSYAGILNTNAAGIKASYGYMTFIRGDRSVNAGNSVSTATVLRTKGNLYIGNQPAVTVPAGLFASLANPYASPVDMRRINKAGVKDFFYVWDPMLGGVLGFGAYQTFSNNGDDNYVITPGGGSYGAGGSISNYVKSGYAFFVQATSAGGTITFNENAKSTGSGGNSFTAGRLNTQNLRVGLFGISADSLYTADGVFVNFADEYANAVDDADAIKSINTGENLSIKNGSRLLVVERKHTVADNDTIKMNISGMRVQRYRFQVTAALLDRNGLTGFLEDNYLHSRTPLNLNDTTYVDFSIEAGFAASAAADRFRIVFKQVTVLPVTFTQVKAYRSNNDVAVEWKVENELNIARYEVERSATGLQFTKFAGVAVTSNGSGSAGYHVLDQQPAEGYNYYRVKSIDLSGRVIYTRIMKVLIGAGKEEITLFPNPIVDNVLGIQLNNAAAGKYSITILNQLGQKLMEKIIDHAAGSATELISLDANIPHDLLEVRVLKPDNSQITKQMMH